jgi:hypothetical protein
MLVGKLADESLVKPMALGLKHHVYSLADELQFEVDSWALPKKQLGWVLLLFIDGGNDNGNVKSSGTSLLSAAKFLSESTVTYIIVRFAASTDDRLSVEMLLDAKYKVQLLASTHALPGFGPNTLLTRANLDRFVAVMNARSSGDQMVGTYLFATQGFDLAIPSARTLLKGTEVGQMQLKSCVHHQWSLRLAAALASSSSSTDPAADVPPDPVPDAPPFDLWSAPPVNCLLAMELACNSTLPLAQKLTAAGTLHGTLGHAAASTDACDRCLAKNMQRISTCWLANRGETRRYTTHSSHVHDTLLPCT